MHIHIYYTNICTLYYTLLIYRRGPKPPSLRPTAPPPQGRHSAGR